jgi:hypothetical protein
VWIVLRTGFARTSPLKPTDIPIKSNLKIRNQKKWELVLSF